jgi:hypothetical protein
VGGRMSIFVFKTHRRRSATITASKIRKVYSSLSTFSRWVICNLYAGISLILMFIYCQWSPLFSS